MGALTVMAMSVDGWVAAIVMLSGAVSYALIRTAPSLAQTIREIGGAWVDVRIKYRRELTTLNARLASVEDVADKNASAVVNVRKLALEEAERIKAEALAEAARVEKDARDKRHAFANHVNGEMSNVRVDLLEALDEVARLKAKLGTADLNHVNAINTLGADVQQIADHLKPPLPKPPVIPHLDPANGDNHNGDQP